jgi:DNA-binding MarR family transcriptional regulator
VPSLSDTKSVKRGPRTIAEKTVQAYLELLDTGSWFRFQVQEQLAEFDLDVEDFRFLELLDREGPMTATAIAARRWCSRQSVLKLAHRLEECGWVSLETVRLPAAEIDENRLAKIHRGKTRAGRKAAQLSLTEEGERLMRTVIPRHAKLVYAFMLAIPAHDVDRLVRTCRKLRDGDVVKLLKEITLRDE